MFFCLKLHRKTVAGLCGTLALLILVAFSLNKTSLPTAVALPETELPIIMYHSLTPRETNPYTVSPDRFEQDLIYLRRNGYTTVFMSEVIAYADGKGTLPKKPIVITFDDGHYNNYYYALPLLKKYDAKILFSPIGHCLDKFSSRDDSQLSYSYVTWAQLREAVATGTVEIGNHSYDLHNGDGMRKQKGESSANYQERLFSDVGSMQQRFYAGIGTSPLTLTYPFGFYSKETVALAKEMGFRATLTCEERTNIITISPDCLYNLGRYRRPPHVSSEEFFTKTVGFT